VLGKFAARIDAAASAIPGLKWGNDSAHSGPGTCRFIPSRPSPKICIPFVLKANEQAEFILIDVPSCKGWGYSADTLRGGKK
jgi:hypothetical protein